MYTIYIVENLIIFSSVNLQNSDIKY